MSSQFGRENCRATLPMSLGVLLPRSLLTRESDSRQRAQKGMQCVLYTPRPRFFSCQEL